MKARNMFGFFFLLVMTVFGVGGLDASQEYITASGCSVSNAGYLKDIAGEYERRTGVRVFVRGGGSAAGIEDLRSGNVDFAASCRGKSHSDPEDVEFVQVAWDVLVFIVHKSNPVENISLDDVRAIYGGRITDWSRLSGKSSAIKLFMSKPQKGLSGLEASIKEMVLKGKDPAMTPNVLSLASGGMVEQMVEKTPGGFATSGFTSSRKRDVKMLKVNGVRPSKENIIKDLYPLKRPLYLLVPARPKPEVKKFVAFVLSREGQRFISSLGVVSLSDVKK